MEEVTKMVIRKIINRIKKCFRLLPRLIKYYIEYFKNVKRLSDGRFQYGLSLCYPCLSEATKTTGFDAHYVYHTAWAARMLSTSKPNMHIDISSSLFFVSIVSAFVPVHFYDYRPAELNLSNISCKHVDVTNLPFESGSIESLSCMHVMEHIGLGRYGDPMDPKGDIKGIEELKRVVAPGGRLLFVVPVGGAGDLGILQFNAHRIYTYQSIIEFFSGFSLETFSLVTDAGGFIDAATAEQANQQLYGCGCFLFKKK